MKVKLQNKLIVGWNEWCSLPDLGISKIKAKIDTGARTSALHADSIREEMVDGEKWIHFNMNPIPTDHKAHVHCFERVVDERNVMSSNGHIEHRYVIETTLKMADKQWLIKITLSNRDPLRYQMLIGRTAMRKRLIVEPGRKLLLGVPE